jgi:hypothetical protein
MCECFSKSSQNFAAHRLAGLPNLLLPAAAKVGKKAAGASSSL